MRLREWCLLSYTGDWSSDPIPRHRFVEAAPAEMGRRSPARTFSDSEHDER